MTTRLSLPLVGPGGEPVDLVRTLNSHGFADLAPLRLDEAAHTLELTVRIPGGRPRRVRVGRGPRRHAAVEVLGPGTPGARTQAPSSTACVTSCAWTRTCPPSTPRAPDDPDLAWAAGGRRAGCCAAPPCSRTS